MADLTATRIRLEIAGVQTLQPNPAALGEERSTGLEASPVGPIASGSLDA
jgi:hypothetical protein